MIFLTVFCLLLNMKHCYHFALSQLQFHTPSEVKMSWRIQCLNLTLMIEGLVIGLHHPIQPYLQSRPQLKGLGLFSLSTHSMIISTSVPLSIWVLKPGTLSSPSWPSMWAIFQELLYEAFPQCPKPQWFHLSLDFTLPLICILSLSTKALFLVQSAASTA